MHGRKLQFLLFSIVLMFAAQPAAAQVVNPDYASCVACHTLPIVQAQGNMMPHGGASPPQPGYIDDTCFGSCHEWTPPQGHSAPPTSPFYWFSYLDPFSYPIGPSVVTQACESCHDTTLPPLNAMHPHDQIPYLPSASMPPPSVLPLFQGDGVANQDPNMGGLVCSTCHDPHDPGYVVLGSGKPSFLRAGDPSGDTLPLCTTCHPAAGPQPVGYDMFIDSLTPSVKFDAGSFEPYIAVSVTITNRGNDIYPGGPLDVMTDEDGMGPVPIDPTPFTDFMYPDESRVVTFDWAPSGPVNNVIFHFLPDFAAPPIFNPARWNEFIRALNFLPPPQNLQVMSVTDSTVDLDWVPPPVGGPVEYHVYRNGRRITDVPLFSPFFQDVGLNPDTPHTYTVQAFAPEGVSSMSNRAGARTMPNMVWRVPQDFPTIQMAIDSASPGTSIHVTPGIYQEALDISWQSGITLRGQDAEGVVLDLSPTGTLDLNPTPGSNITIAGFTIVNGTVLMGEGDTISRCVFPDSGGNAVEGGGFVTNSTFEYASGEAISVPPFEFMMVANSLFLQPNALWVEVDADVFLLNNDFAGGYYWDPHPGEGNFAGPSVCFEPPGPPDSYVPCPASSDIDAGADVGLPINMAAPDVGPFEWGFPYTPAPPTDLTTVWDDFQGGIVLNWTESPDDPFFFGTDNPVMEYLVYQNSVPDHFPNPPIANIPAGMTTFTDMGAPQGVPSYYQVRASTGLGPLPGPDPMIISLPTNTSFLVDPPEYLEVWSVSDSSVELWWNPPSSYPIPGELTYNVYRNGKLITPVPIPPTNFSDFGLVNETPHTYTVQAVAPNGAASLMSNRVGAKTAEGWMIVRVPQDFATIQEAIWYSSPGTSIHVSPGFYFEGQLDMSGVYGVSIVGQDADGVIVDVSMYQMVDLDMTPGTGNTISGMTIVGGTVLMGDGDTVTNCVFRDSPYDSVYGGGFVTNSVFDLSWYGYNSVTVQSGEHMTVANSIFMNTDPLLVLPGGELYLINNMFDPNTGLDWSSLPGEGNFAGWPCFDFPGPPLTYRTAGCGPEHDAGADVGLFFWDAGLDVGAFEWGLPYSPNPPSNLTLGWNDVPAGVELNWDPSTDDPYFYGTGNPIVEYLVYRSDLPDFFFEPPIFVPAGVTTYVDTLTIPGITYYYQVRASMGIPWPSNDPIVSAPTDTASFTVNIPPTLQPVGPQFMLENESLHIPLSAFDPDIGDILAFTEEGLPPFCTLTDSGGGNGAIDCGATFDDAGIYQITLTVSDDGIPVLSDGEIFDLTVTNVNRAPNVTNPGPQISSENDIVSLQIVASDDDIGDTLTYSATGLPAGLAINTATGLIDGTLTFDSAGVSGVIVTVTDGQDPTAVNFSWTVNDTGRAPNVTNPGSQTNDEGDAVSLQIAASDPDGDTLTYSATGLPANLSINTATGLISGTLTFDSAGAYSVDVTVTDGQFPVTVNFAWTVNGTNRAPDVTNPGPQTNSENDTVSLQIAATDDDGDTLSYSATGLPGGLSINAATGLIDGTLTFDSAGAYSVDVTVTDGQIPVTVNFAWTVNGTNRAPDVTNPGPQTNSENDTVSLQIAATDDDGDTLSYSATGLPGGLSINAATGLIDGTLTYDSAGAYSVDVTVTDGQIPVTVNFAWTVNGTNRAPDVTNPGPQTSSENDIVSLQISATDLDGDTLSYSATGLPGGLSINAATGLIDGTLTFDSAGAYSVDVTVTDGQIPVTVNFAWTVNGTNRAPDVTNPGPQTNSENDTVSLQIAATDDDGDTLSYSATGLPGGLSINAATGLIDGTLTYDSAGAYSVDVTVTDGQDPTAINFAWTVNGTNRAPDVTNPGPQTSSENDIVSLQISATDLDGDTLSYSATGLPGGLSINAATGLIDGTLTFDSAGAYSVDVTVTDGQDPTAVNFAWTVNGTNRAPDVTNPGPQTSSENDIVSLQISATDLDGDTLSYSATGLPGGLSINAATGLIDGTLTFDSAGAYSVDVTVTDGQDPTAINFAWTVNGTNRAPDVTNPGPQTNSENDTVSLQIAATDDDGDTLSYSATGLPANLSINAATGLISGTLTFDSAGGYSVDVTVTDGQFPVTVNFPWTVNDTGRAPIVTNPGPQSNSEDDIVSLQIVASDPDGDTLSYSATGLPANLSINTATGLISGTLTFDSAGGYSVDVTVTDGQFPVTVNFAWTVNDVPLMHVESITTGFRVSKGKTYYSAEVLVLDDGGAPLAGVDVTGHWAGSSADSTPATLSTDSGGTVVFETNGIKKPSGVYTFTIDDVVKAGYTYDEAGSVTSGQYPPPAQNPPVANDDSYSVDEGATLNVAAPGVLGNDTDAESDPLTAVPDGGPSHGSLNLNPDGSFTYTHDGSETTVDSFTYRANDGTVDSNTATVTIAINPLNDAPQAADDSASTQPDTPVIVDVLANDSDAEGDILTVSAVTQGANGTVVNNGTEVTYSPNPGYTGPDSFTYRANDGTADSNDATVFITVTGVNQPPNVTNPGPQTNNEGDTGISLQIVASDDDGDTLSYSASGLPAGLAIDPVSGLISGALDFTTAGVYSVDVTVTDGIDPVLVNFSWTVNGGNLPPVADAGPDQSGSRRQNLTFDGSGSSDLDGTIVSWSWDFGDGKGGSGEVVVHSYKRANTYTVTLTVTDDLGAQATDTAIVTIN